MSIGITTQDKSWMRHQEQGRHRRPVLIGLAVLLILGLLIGIRGVSANNTDAQSNTAAEQANTKVTPLTKIDDGGSTMNQTDNSTASGGQNVTSHSVTSHVSSTTNSNGETSNSVTVNGQPVDVPANGSYSRTFSDQNGTTQVNISNGSSGTSSSSSVSIQVDGSSSSTSD